MATWATFPIRSVIIIHGSLNSRTAMAMTGKSIQIRFFRRFDMIGIFAIHKDLCML